MTKTELFNNVSRTFHRVGFKLKKHSPEILIVTGVIGTVTSAVMACRATTKVQTILDEHKEEMDKVHSVLNDPAFKEVYTEKDSKRDTVINYTNTGLKFVKLYGPAVFLGAASLGCIVWSHNLLRGRNAALAAAYATVDRGFRDYRGRVIERFGEEMDRELKYNIKAKEIEETVVDENGETKVVKKTVEVIDPNLSSPYAKFFDEYCAGWEKDAEHNYYFLHCQQAHANDMLRTRGHLFLNEVYDMLGIPRTKAGNIVGWYYDEKHPVGDNFVDFGIFNVHDPAKRDFVNGRERSILLDFNVDGNILDLMS